MKQIATAPLAGEIIPPGRSVRAVGLAHPLKGRRIDVTVPAGVTISEILAEALKAHPGSRLVKSFLVQVDGEPIPAAWFDRVRLKAGSTLTFQPDLQGDNPLKTILSFAIVIAALVVAGPLAGALGLTGIGLSIGTALISTGIVLAGTMALNALFPTRPKQLDGVSSSLNSIQGSNNQANPFGPIPAVLGEHRQSPFYAARPYTELVGDDQFLRLLFCFGYGPISISDHKIGETPLAAFSDVETEIRQGFVGDPDVTLYPASVDEQALAVELTLANSWQSRITAIDADEISFDITAPEGIYQVNTKTGALDSWRVVVEYRYRPVGADAWTSTGTLELPRSSSPARKGVRWTVARGQWEVQVRKTSGFPTPSDTIRDKAVWSALRSFTNVHPISFPKPLALVSMRIRATNQLSSVIDTYNAVSASLVTAFDGADWHADTVSRNPADLFRHVLQGAANSRPRTEAEIDIENLEEWWAYCAAKGFKFDQIRSQRSSVYDCLADIAAAGRAVPTFIDGKWGVIWDRPEDTIAQHFTPRNSWGFSGSRPYVTIPHAWRVKFINAANGYTQDERIVYADGYDKTNATLFEALEFPGVTDPDLIWKHGRFHYAQVVLRPEEITLSAGWDNIACTRGDRVSVQHDAALIGQISGRVKAIDGQTVTLDETVIMEPGKNYGIVFRNYDARGIFSRVVTLDVGEHLTINLDGPDDTLPDVGDLFSFGEVARETSIYRVKTIRHQKALVATIVLVDDAPAISTADQGAVPPYDPNVTIPPDPLTLGPQDLTYLEAIDGQGASASAVVRLSWTSARLGNIASFEVQQRDDNEGGDWVRVDSVLPPSTRSNVPLTSAGVWSYRVRCIFKNGTASDWLTLDHLTLLGLSRPPAPVTNLRNTYITGRMHLAWDRPVDPRIVPIEIRKGSSFEAAQIVSDDALNPWQTVGDDVYWVTSYVVSPFGERIYSDPKQSIDIERSVSLENVVVSHDERGEGWTGYFSGTVGKDTLNNYLRTSGGDPFLARPDFLGSENFLDEGLQGGGYYWSRSIVNIGRRAFCRISNDWTATGVPVGDDFLANPDFLGQPDFLKSYLSQFIRVRPVIRISKTGPGDAFAEANIFEPNDVFLAGTQWEPIKIWSPDVYDGWMFQLGMQFEILTDAVLDPGAIAYLLSWVWTVDVPDRFDSYQDLAIPVEGLVINFRPTGSLVDAAFNGGLNNEPLPHITTSIRNPTAGDVIAWEDLTLSSVRLFVKNAGVSVARNEVNALVRGY